MADDRVIVMGSPPSPYTRKMLAVLRYRHIPYSFISRKDAQDRGLPAARVPLLPTLYFPENPESPVTDTSPIIRQLEGDLPGRSIIPDDPVLALIDMLLEDYGDEWLTKAMFHYRWVRQADIDRSTTMLPLWFDRIRPDTEIHKAGEAFAKRQISRLDVVGSNAQTGPLIEQSYERLLGLLDTHLTDHPFLLGSRPGAGDFAIFGQLTQLAGFDPTPMELTFATAPRVHAWMTAVEDLTGVEPKAYDWVDAEALPDTLIAILAEIGRTYVPVMLANAQAVADDDQTVDATVNGTPWRQRTFPYQAKCVRWLREAFALLSAEDQDRLQPILTGTGCAQLFQP
ncbi:MAG: glutathione S-transferase family protein [Pseudomonadota bacterium]